MIFTLRAVGVFFLLKLLSPVTTDENCDARLCSNFYDPVCGLATKDGASIIKKFHNVCHLKKIRCRLESLVDIKQVPNHLCNIKQTHRSGRRVYDFSIMGAHQSCNHTCPTYCLDTYDPACAQIWKSDMETYSYRPMINHCHIDMFSCVVGVNVTVQPLSKCYKNPSGLMFMSHIAAMKSLNLIDD
ncbi:uncharacterized protein [Epargyreus clarus]|uniref:uncharacterized protein n=1 Tax=Epargyreus clarus TaxID=520877 RepID=UPI003C30BF61